MKRWLLLPLLAFCLCGASSAPSGEDDAANYRAYMDEGTSLLRSGSQDEISRSIAKFKSALKIRPDSAEAYYWLALAYSDLNNYLRAADNARDATTYDDRLAEAWLLWGQILLYQREWNEALRKLDTAARLTPDDPMVLYNLGRVYYHGFRDPDNALAKFRTAWQIGQSLRRDNPEMIAMTVRSRFYMGCCEFDRGLRQNNFNNVNNFENAINAFSDVVKEQPYNMDARLRLALALRKANRLLDSIAILQGLLQGMEQARGNVDVQLRAEVHLQLADIYLKEPQVRTGNFQLALMHLTAFIRLMGDSSHSALEAAKEFVIANTGADGSLLD